MKFEDTINEVDCNGDPTPLAMALEAISEHGCDCDAVDCEDEHTCIGGRKN